jgi:hypothetical protein
MRRGGNRSNTTRLTAINGAGIPLSSACDKLEEARYFFHELIRNYHHPDEFRYSLSAFFQAARSTTDLIRTELARHPGFKKWWKLKYTSVENDLELRQLIGFRDTTVHISSLVPASEMFAGHFKYGRPKAGIEMPLPPEIPTLQAFFDVRRVMANHEHPHRSWSGEEFGIQRTWKLKEVPDRELVEFCMKCFNKYSSLIADVHEWLGKSFKSELEQEHDRADFGTLRESDVFSEVSKAWDSSATEIVIAKKRDLKLAADPGPDSETLHLVMRGSRVKGWVGAASPFWDPQYSSMLVYSIDENIVESNTSVFFKRSDATVRKLKHLEKE